ncbi:UNVERIFIED_CONTAM: hypothetical protein FKN15_002144 [Acipenser sinensis]
MTPVVWPGACRLACKLPRAALFSDAVALGGCMVSLQCVKKQAANGTRFGGQHVFVFTPPESAQGYFVLDMESGLLQYFVNELSKSQKPRGVLPLTGATVSLSDEAPHMFIVYATNGELYKLRAADAKEQQYWINQLQAYVKSHSEGNAKGLILWSCDISFIERQGTKDIQLYNQATGRYNAICNKRLSM